MRVMVLPRLPAPGDTSVDPCRPHHDGQRAVDGANRRQHRRIKKNPPGGASFGGDVARRQRQRWCSCRWQSAWGAAVDHAVFTQYDFFHVRGIQTLLMTISTSRASSAGLAYTRALGDQFGGAFRATGINR